MQVPRADIYDLSWRPDDQPRAAGVKRFRYPGWIWLSYIMFGIAVWTGVAFGIAAL
jgi:hypothetical protein